MVFLSRALWAGKKMRNYMRSGFMDSLRLRVVGGSGGCGLPRYGGRGGQGGCVFCVGTADATLASLERKYHEKCVRAGHGENSKNNMILGPPGLDEVLQVPVGLTLIRDSTILGEINEVGTKMILARGGPGGSSHNGWIGGEGQEYTLQLELRLIADVGLLGFPNAGKSTLLRAVSRAKPRVASYPFTTIRPNIGVMQYPDLRHITVADLPGLVEGAHLNIGMGHSFLRHVERTKLHLMLVDINGFSLSAKHKHRSCLENILLLNKELEMYNPELLTKPTILVVNKMDTPDAEKNFDKLRVMLDDLEGCRDIVPEEMWPQELIRFEEIMAISAKEALRVMELKDLIRLQLDISAAAEEERVEGALRASLTEMLVEKGPALT